MEGLCICKATVEDITLAGRGRQAPQAQRRTARPWLARTGQARLSADLNAGAAPLAVGAAPAVLDLLEAVLAAPRGAHGKQPSLTQI